MAQQTVYVCRQKSKEKQTMVNTTNCFNNIRNNRTSGVSMACTIVINKVIWRIV